MKRTAALLGSLLLALTSQLSTSQEITVPAMSTTRFSETAARTPADGRRVYRVGAAYISLIRVEWPKGTRTTPHNHSGEIVLTVVEGRLQAISGEREFVLEAGDVVTIPAWVEHSFFALEDSISFEATGP